MDTLTCGEFLLHVYRIVENLDSFDERRAIRQSFSFQSFKFPVNTFPMKATINLSKFCSSKLLTCSIHQILSDFSIKVLRYTAIECVPLHT